jgi:hypothetical protein
VIGRTYLECGLPALVVARWSDDGPRNVLVRHEDESLVVRPFRGLRRQAAQHRERARLDLLPDERAARLDVQGRAGGKIRL